MLVELYADNPDISPNYPASPTTSAFQEVIAFSPEEYASLLRLLLQHSPHNWLQLLGSIARKFYIL